MNTDTPTTHGGISPNLKLFLVIVAAIVVALVAFTVGKGIWDNHQASVARDQAAKVAAEQARQEQITKLFNDPTVLPHTWHEMDKTMTQLHLENNVRHSLTITWLGEMWDKSRATYGKYLRIKDTDTGYFEANRQMLEDLRAKINAINTEYNNGAATLANQELINAGLFTELPLI